MLNLKSFEKKVMAGEIKKIDDSDKDKLVVTINTKVIKDKKSVNEDVDIYIRNSKTSDGTEINNADNFMKMKAKVGSKVCFIGSESKKGDFFASNFGYPGWTRKFEKEDPETGDRTEVNVFFGYVPTPRVKDTQSGNKMATLSFAVSSKKDDPATWYSVAFVDGGKYNKKDAENIEKYVKKGTLMLVSTSSITENLADNGNTYFNTFGSRYEIVEWAKKAE